jgi:membrane associated rhomboid family serine protease
MDEAPIPVEEVYRSNRKDCMHYAMVLEAAGIPCQIRKKFGEFIIVAPASLIAQARGEIEAYASENRASPLVITTVLEPSSGWVGVFGYAIVLLLMFLLERHGILSERWLDAGKTHAGLIRQGEWWRAVTALSLHGDLVHLVANIGAGGLIGLFAGQLLGSGFAWFSILLAGTVGNLLNAWIRDLRHTSVGASTSVFAAFGIVAAFVAIQRRHARTSRFVRYAPIVGAVVLLSYLGTSGERTDVLAHVAGFLAGLLLGALYGMLGDRIRMRARTQFLYGFGAVALLGLAWLTALTRLGI